MECIAMTFYKNGACESASNNAIRSKYEPEAQASDLIALEYASQRSPIEAFLPTYCPA